MMKKLFAQLLFLSFVINSSAQVINFPDANFKAKLLQANSNVYIAHGSDGTFRKIDTNNNNEIEVSEAQTITYLAIDGANISNVTGLAFFSNLHYFNCSDNNLTTLDVSALYNLIEFNCSYNLLTDIIFSTNSIIETFNCSHNNLTQLDLNLLPNLLDLRCYSNQLQSLSFINKSMNSTDAIYNQITNITAVNSQLGSLSVANNNLTELDLSTCSFSGLSVDDNNLVSFNIKNGRTYPISNNAISFSNNPDLHYICINEIDFTAISQRLVQYNYTNTCNVNSYCSFTPGGNFYVIQGNSKFDSNNNGCDVLDTFYPNLRYSITNGINSGIYIANTGAYSIPTLVGTHTITPILENPTYYNVSPSSFQVNFPVQTSPFTQNICITPNGIHQDLEISILPLLVARPGFDATYSVVYKNKGNTAQSGNVTLSFEDDLMDLVLSNPIYTNQSLGLLSWDYSNLQPLETREIELRFNINSPMEIPAVNIGDQLDFTATINPLAGDEYLPDNTNSLKQIVVGSLDPNDKTCIEGNSVGPEMIGQYVHYVIRFENTGTFAAENIVVKDMINLTKFDLNSLVPISASHSFVTRIANNGKVEFIFENIQLPFDDASNDGYIAFKIKTKPNLVVGDTFTNNASIYFDYNFPIETNVASTTIQVLGNQDFEFSNYFNLFPNPAGDVLNIQIKNTIELNSLSVYNTLGQLVLVIPEVSQVDAIDVSNLKTGSYFIKLITDKGITCSKFFKK